MPSEVAHLDFWQRYFYKVHQLEQDETRRTKFKERADNVMEDLKWDGNN